jgi:glycosyltransferase involved in cell wall biosynthesis
MIRVVYWNNIPAPYMVDRFNALVRRGNLDFEAWFSARTELDRSWKVEEFEWQFAFRYLPAVKVGHRPFTLPAAVLTSPVPDVFVSLYAAPSFLLGSALARLRGARTALWVEVTYDAWIRRRRWKEALKSRILPQADAILTAGEDGAAFARRYGAQSDRIFCVPHVIDAAHYMKGSALPPSERDRLRQELGLRGVAFIYVGRLWHGKGLTYLLDAFAALQAKHVAETSLLLVGDGPEENVLRDRCKQNGLSNVVFSGFQDADTLTRLYGLADVFVFPTLGDPFGLVVLEAMACGLPIISTTAAGEIGGRVQESVNGFIVPPANTQELFDRMKILACNGELRRSMGIASATKVTGQSPDVWAEAFENAVHRILLLPPVKDVDSNRTRDLHGARSGGE